HAQQVPLPLSPSSDKLILRYRLHCRKDGRPMRIFRTVAVLLALAGPTSAGHAGLYYSGEQIDELPSQWRGFLLDQRALRTVAVKPSATKPASPLRLQYEEALGKLEKAGRERKLSADELADQGALYVRLGESA